MSCIRLAQSHSSITQIFFLTSNNICTVPGNYCTPHQHLYLYLESGNYRTPRQQLCTYTWKLLYSSPATIFLPGKWKLLYPSPATTVCTYTWKLLYSSPATIFVPGKWKLLYPSPATISELVNYCTPHQHLYLYLETIVTLTSNYI